MIATVCDSNVYISAIVFGGIPRDVVMLGEHKQIQLLVSPGLIFEVERVLTRKFEWEQRRVRRILPTALGSRPTRETDHRHQRLPRSQR